MQPMDPWFLQPLGLGDETVDQGSSGSGSKGSRRKPGRDSIRTSFSTRGSASLNLHIKFNPVAAFNSSIRLPQQPRTFYLTVEDQNNERIICGQGSPYSDQTVTCQGLVPGQYTVTAFDSGRLTACWDLESATIYQKFAEDLSSSRIYCWLVHATAGAAGSSSS